MPRIDIHDFKELDKGNCKYNIEMLKLEQMQAQHRTIGQNN